MKISLLVEVYHGMQISRLCTNTDGLYCIPFFLEWCINYYHGVLGTSGFVWQTTGLLQLLIGLHCLLVSCIASDRLHILLTDGLYCLLAGCIAYWCTVWPSYCSWGELCTGLH